MSYREKTETMATTLAVLTLSPLYGVAKACTCLYNRTRGMDTFFKQTRYGQNNAPFEVWKFQSMVPGAEKDSRRITSFGRIIRKINADELAQLRNVRAGEMNIIGYRPLSSDRYRWLDILDGILEKQDLSDENRVNLQRIRDKMQTMLDEMHRHKPGLTSASSVAGYRGRHDSPDFRVFYGALKADFEYYKKREQRTALGNLCADFKICVQTVPVLFQGHATRDDQIAEREKAADTTYEAILSAA